MDIKINYNESSDYLGNLAYIRALLIKLKIERLDVNYEEKKNIYNKVLELLCEK